MPFAKKFDLEGRKRQKRIEQPVYGYRLAASSAKKRFGIGLGGEPSADSIALAGGFSIRVFLPRMERLDRPQDRNKGAVWRYGEP